MRHFKTLCGLIKKKVTNFASRGLETCQPLSLTKRTKELFPCDLEDVDFLNSPLQTFCFEMYNGDPIFKVGNRFVLAIKAHEPYPNHWEYVVLFVQNRKTKFVTFLPPVDSKLRNFHQAVRLATKIAIKRMNREFLVRIPCKELFKVPFSSSDCRNRYFGYRKVLTPYLDETEPLLGLTVAPHLFPEWLRGIWLPVAKYGADRSGVWTANWQWTVVDDDRVFKLNQRFGRKACYSQDLVDKLQSVLESSQHLHEKPVLVLQSHESNDQDCSDE
jgi:hypothetical protein